MPKKLIHFNAVALKAQKNKQQLLSVVSKVINTGTFLHGPENEKLQKTLCRILHKGHITLTGSGHDSLLLALQAVNIKPADEVIIPVNAYPIAFPVALSGARIVLVDTTDNGQMDVDDLQRKITKHTRAVIVAHLYGLLSDIDTILQITRKRNIKLIEDCAQAFGSYYKGRHVGTIGDIGCISFYPTKNIGTLGDGGALWTKSKGYHEYFNRAVSYGEDVQYKSHFVSGHSRIPEIQAGILNMYLKTFKINAQHKKQMYKYYREKVREHKLENFVRLYTPIENTDATPHLLVAEVKNRDLLKEYLSRKGIPTYIHYPIPIHQVAAFKYLGYKKGDFPMAERLSQGKISLPFHAYITKKQIDYVLEHIRKFYENT